MKSLRNTVAIIFFGIIAVLFIFTALSIQSFGPSEGEESYEAPMDDYIIEHFQKETGANNGVTSVVFDYRGFDTLGEATVLFTAVAGVILIFRRMKK